MMMKWNNTNPNRFAHDFDRVEPKADRAWRLVIMQRQLNWLETEAARLHARRTLLPLAIERLRQAIFAIQRRPN